MHKHVHDIHFTFHNTGQELLQSPDIFDIAFPDIIMRNPDGMTTVHSLRGKPPNNMVLDC